MAIRRGARFPPSYMSTKRRTAYSAMPTRYPLPTSRYYDTRSEDYLLSDRVSNASFLSNYALDEGYDTAKRSRGRDAQLLRDATHAIVTSESFATPQASVAARRVARGQSMVPRAASAPPRPLSVEAAIIASKMEPDPIKRRRPRSEYAAKKYRALNMDAKEGVFTKVPRSSGLYASNPPLPKPSDRKAIRTEDGYAKPKNVLSWQYRLESKMTPGDLLYQPSSFSRIRERVREAQDGMDRHRQMLDRYMPEEGADTKDAAAKVLRKMAEMEKRDTIVSSASSGKQKEKRRAKEAPY